MAQSALIAFVFYSSLKRPDIFLLAAAVAFFGWLGVITLRRLGAVNDRVAVDNTAIWYLPSRGAATCIRWSEVAGTRQYKIMSYLMISNTSDTRKIKLEYSLVNFDDLQKIVHERTKTPQAQQPSAHRRTATKTAKTFVRPLYSAMRTISLPFILMDKLFGARPYVSVASVTATLATLIWIFAPVQDSVGVVAILIPGLILSYLFGAWGKEFEREREIK